MGEIANLVSELEKNLRNTRELLRKTLSHNQKLLNEVAKLRELGAKNEQTYRKAVQDRSRLQLRVNALKKKLEPSNKTLAEQFGIKL